MKMVCRRTRFWRAGSERAAVSLPALTVASSPRRTFGGHTHIVSKAGLGGAAARGGVLPLARESDGGGATRAAVCQRQPRGLGAEQVTRAPKTTIKRPVAINPLKREVSYE